jgi:putative ABC transport system permease protein
MIRLALHAVFSRPWLSALSFLALVTVSVTAGTLATVARTTQANFVGDSRRAWTTPYDLLVRPRGSQTALEQSDGLVRPNFIGGIKGGIGADDLAVIRSIGGVDVAAPIAMVGFVNQPSLWSVSLPHDQDGAFRVQVESLAEGGESRYQLDDRYVVVSTSGGFRPIDLGQNTGVLETADGKVNCGEHVACFAPEMCSFASCDTRFPAMPGFRTDLAAYELYVMQPLMIAGIDPDAEAKLAKIDGCVTSGRYLAKGDKPLDMYPATKDDLERIPVLASSHSFVDETMSLTVTKALDPTAIFAGQEPAGVTGWEPQDSRKLTVADLYQDFLSSQEWIDPYPVWTAGDVSYKQLGPRAVQPTQVASNVGIYLLLQGGVGMAGPVTVIPPAARDRSFREVDVHGDGYLQYPGSAYRLKIFDKVGTYDPACIPGWDPLAGGQLDAYSYPAVRLENGNLLTPTRSMSGYVNSPPLVLTTLESAAWLDDPDRYHGQPGARFISVVRVRVGGAEEPNDASEAKLAAVAASIRERTGLDVDVVKGSSLTDVSVDLPAGLFGRPRHTAVEGWSAKGVVIHFVQAIESQGLLFVALAFVVVAVFVGTASYVAMRQRRREFATLRALGWPSSRLAAMVEIETLAVGGAAAIVAIGIGLVAGRVLAPDATGNFLAAAVIMVGVAALAGLVPASAVVRRPVARVLRGDGRIRRVPAPRSIASLALRELSVESRAQTAISIAMLALGSAAIGSITLIATAFNGRLDVTILGRFFAAKAEPHHFLVAGIVVLLAAIENAQLLVLSYVERREQLATLRALGWRPRDLVRLLAAEGVSLTAIGAGLGASITIVAGLMVGGTPLALVGSAAIGAAACLLASFVAMVAVLWRIQGRPIVDGLRDA